MRLRGSLILVAVALLAVVASVPSAAAWQAKAKADAISGEWEAVLTGPDNTAQMNLKLKLEGEKVTGTFGSDHLGNGTISNGSWANNELKITVATDHATLELTGGLHNGKLGGDWSAGHMQGKWEAKKSHHAQPH